ncbi:prepilin-type N-terminal cleavage/methylation domain-containing protein [Paenibacillus chibensis]|uniref:Prepilin-type N-terminal cleavage/methylation domain-containing protein n=1 Tax=Paenibacillus chibensis TaxID=59846 RepID=A0ABU6PWG1_9BACL|nr:prepilin-type N-terminal cleavage/methylation domain-containing protein [Paenibacillus chibensis]
MEAVLKKRFGKLGREEKGFTLIELLAVIVIIGIIAVIAIPLIGNILSKSKESADVATARQIYDAARLYVTSELNGDFVGTSTDKKLDVSVKKLMDEKYLSKDLFMPSSKVAITDGTVSFSDGDLSTVTLKGGSSEAALATYTAKEVLSSTKSKQ